MSGRHKYQNITFYPPEPLRLRLLAYVARVGIARSSVINAAVADWLDRHDNEGNDHREV